MQHGFLTSAEAPGKVCASSDRSVGSNLRTTGPSDTANFAGARVLVVEDDYFIGEAAATALAEVGCKVTGPIGRVEEALRLAKDTDLDAAALDINLHGERIWPVARALQAREIPFIFATGYSEKMDIPSEFAAIATIEKPYRTEQFVSYLAALSPPAPAG